MDQGPLRRLLQALRDLWWKFRRDTIDQVHGLFQSHYGSPQGVLLCFRVRLQEAAGEAFVCLKPEHSLRQLTDSFCQLAGFRPQVVFESDEPSTIRGLIRAGLGIAFVPALSWRGSVGSAVVEISIKEPICQRTIGLSWQAGRSLGRAAEEFRTFAVTYFGQLGDGEVRGFP